MKWEKKGLIYGPGKDIDWAVDSFLQPTPLVLADRIRVFGGMRDANGVSRIGYVDLDCHNPSVVLGVSKKPVLDIGNPGFFDDNGVVPCAVVVRDDKVYMYYAGYQLATKVRFVAYSGLAISNDNGNTFTRYKTVPIIERAPGEELFRAIHSIIYVDGVWKVYYGAGNRYVPGEKKTLPLYNIRYAESADGLTFPSTEGRVILSFEADEYRVGRPYVFYRGGTYHMFFGYSTGTISYKLTYASSKDGINWHRDDAALGLDFSADGFDSEMMAYPSVVCVDGVFYLFYNGNDYGKHGFGYAQLSGREL